MLSALLYCAAWIYFFCLIFWGPARVLIDQSYSLTTPSGNAKLSVTPSCSEKTKMFFVRLFLAAEAYVRNFLLLQRADKIDACVWKQHAHAKRAQIRFGFG